MMIQMQICIQDYECYVEVYFLLTQTTDAEGIVVMVFYLIKMVLCIGDFKGKRKV